MITENNVTPEALVADFGARARKAAAKLAVSGALARNSALENMASALLEHADALREANRRDLEAGREAGLTPAMLDRLELNDKRIKGMADGLREVAALPDPVGEIFEMRTRPNGLRVGRMRMPIGVVGIIYESRPNVTAEAAALCLKSGNACILRGGREAIHSNRAIGEVLRAGLVRAGLNEDCVQLVPTTDRAVVNTLCASPKAVDCIVPRGGKGLIEAVMAVARVPVIKHLDGNCHVYIHEKADFEAAERIAINSKTHRTGVCNAAETLLLDRALPRDFVAGLLAKLLSLRVELRGCPETLAIEPRCKPATEDDWYAEYLDMILAVKVVDGLEHAIEHINHYGSHHTEAIVSQDYSACMHFVRAIDSACVHVNASTRFSDGGEYGLGCEIGISTDKLHARGPMGLAELTTPRWVVLGEGHIRE